MAGTLLSSPGHYFFFLMTPFQNFGLKVVLPQQKGGGGSYSEFQVANRGTSPDKTAVFHAWPYGWFKVIQSNLRRKKLHIKNRLFNSLGGFFSNRDNVRAPIQFRRESQPQHLKRQFFLTNKPINFHINSVISYYTCQTIPVEFFQNWNQQPTSCTSPVSCRSDFKSTCCYKSDACLQLE